MNGTLPKRAESGTRIITRMESGCRNRPAHGTSVRPKNFRPCDLGSRSAVCTSSPSKLRCRNVGANLASARAHKRSWQRDEQMHGNLQSFFGTAMLDSITPLQVEGISSTGGGSFAGDRQP